MQIFFTNSEHGLTVSTWPFEENGQNSQLLEIAEEDYEAVQNGTKEWALIDEQLQAVPSTRKADLEAEALSKEQAEAASRSLLKTKLETKTASLDEIQEALAKFL
jgi:hypothetical protein